jgi:hypothetical protein
MCKIFPESETVPSQMVLPCQPPPVSSSWFLSLSLPSLVGLLNALLCVVLTQVSFGTLLSCHFHFSSSLFSSRASLQPSAVYRRSAFSSSPPVPDQRACCSLGKPVVYTCYNEHLKAGKLFLVRSDD